MQISRTFLVVCAVTCVTSSIAFAAPDSLSQAQARETLRKKIDELNAQEKAGHPAPAPVAVPATTTTVVKAPDRKSADVIKAEQTAAAVEEKRLADEAKAMEKAAAKEKKRAADAAKARQAKDGKAKQEAATTAKPAPFTPIETPPASVPAAKEVRLNELLSKYKTDALTPEEYHKERARILAEP